jgi:hypothetical protein
MKETNRSTVMNMSEKVRILANEILNTQIVGGESMLDWLKAQELTYTRSAPYTLLYSLKENLWVIREDHVKEIQFECAQDAANEYNDLTFSENK